MPKLAAKNVSSVNDKSGRKSRPTIKDVAATAGVAIASVSRVLNDGKYVSSDLRMRITKAVEDLGYVPDTAARTMRARSTLTIGCMVSDMSNPLYAEIIGAAEDVLQKEGYLVLMASTRHDEQREVAFVSTLRQRRVDGILFTAGSDQHHRTTASIGTLDIPCVAVDRILPGIPAVYVDHRSGATEATRYLLSMGHRRIALLLGRDHVRPTQERAAGYRKAHELARVPIDGGLIRNDVHSSSFAFSEMTRLLALTDRPTAVIALGTHTLAGVLQALSSSGLKVPADMSVISIGDTDLATYASPPITSITWDLAETGRTAAKLLLESLQTGATVEPETKMFLPTKLTIRQSCAAPQIRPANA